VLKIGGASKRDVSSADRRERDLSFVEQVAHVLHDLHSRVHIPCSQAI